MPTPLRYNIITGEPAWEPSSRSSSVTHSAAPSNTASRHGSISGLSGISHQLHTNHATTITMGTSAEAQLGWSSGQVTSTPPRGQTPVHATAQYPLTQQALDFALGTQSPPPDRAESSTVSQAQPSVASTTYSNEAGSHVNDDCTSNNTVTGASQSTSDFAPNPTETFTMPLREQPVRRETINPLTHAPFQPPAPLPARIEPAVSGATHARNGSFSKSFLVTRPKQEKPSSRPATASGVPHFALPTASVAAHRAAHRGSQTSRSAHGPSPSVIVIDKPRIPIHTSKARTLATYEADDLPLLPQLTECPESLSSLFATILPDSHTKYSVLFHSHEIDLIGLLMMTQVHLKELKIPIGPRLKIAATIYKLRQMKGLAVNERGLLPAVSEGHVPSSRPASAAATVPVASPRLSVSRRERVDSNASVNSNADVTKSDAVFTARERSRSPVKRTVARPTNTHSLTVSSQSNGNDGSSQPNESKQPTSPTPVRRVSKNSNTITTAAATTGGAAAAKAHFAALNNKYRQRAASSEVESNDGSESYSARSLSPPKHRKPPIPSFSKSTESRQIPPVIDNDEEERRVHAEKEKEKEKKANELAARRDARLEAAQKTKEEKKRAETERRERRMEKQRAREREQETETKTPSSSHTSHTTSGSSTTISHTRSSISHTVTSSASTENASVDRSKPIVLRRKRNADGTIALTTAASAAAATQDSQPTSELKQTSQPQMEIASDMPAAVSVAPVSASLALAAASAPNTASQSPSSSFAASVPVATTEPTSTASSPSTLVTSVESMSLADGTVPAPASNVSSRSSSPPSQSQGASPLSTLSLPDLPLNYSSSGATSGGRGGGVADVGMSEALSKAKARIEAAKLRHQSLKHSAGTSTANTTTGAADLRSGSGEVQ